MLFRWRVVSSAGGGEYDALNRRTATTRTLFDAGDSATEGTLRSTTTYDPASNVVATSDFEGRSSSSRYDGAGRLVETTDPAGNRTVRTMDGGGNAVQTDRIEVVAGGDAVTVSSTATFDALGRRVSNTDALSNTTRTTHDARSNVIRSVDAEGNLTTSSYDGLDRNTRTVKPEGISVDYLYDGNSRLREYTDALGNKTTFTFDALDRPKTTTYPDQTVETIEVYDGADNPTQISDPNGNAITQSFDASNRMTSRTVAPGSGVIGVTAETYGYDGLNRLKSAASGGVATSFTYDSLSRMTSESTVVDVGAAKVVNYQHDLVGSVKRIEYPSGHAVTMAFDALDRPSNVAGEVTYGYRGADLVKTRTFANGVNGTMTFDGVRRAIANSHSRPGGGTAFAEQIAWSPRSLKVETTRDDLGGKGLILGYDGTGRVTAAQRVASAQAANNTAPSVNVTTGTGGFSFAYDAAENLLSRQAVSPEGTETVPLPLDSSKRNRPGAVGDTTLAYDANGNLTQKGEMNFHYDYRNRLARVTDSGGAEVASYSYDAFNRRVAKTVGGVTEQTVWGGWQNLETYDGGQLASRRTFGAGLDEIVQSEADIDGDGVLETATTPLYDSNGNLALSTGPDGRTLERYEYTPYGERKIYAGLLGPVVEQIRTVGDELWIELSKGALPVPLQAAVTAGTLDLSVDGTSQSVTVTQPVTSGRQARRRLALAGGAVSAGASVELAIPAAALVDEFGNAAAADFGHSFTWPAGNAVLFDSAGPRVSVIAVNDGTLEVQLTEEADTAAAGTTITVNGAATSWTLSADGYTLISTMSLPAGEQNLVVSTGALDLSGQGLTEPLVLTFIRSNGTNCTAGAVCASSEQPFVYEGSEPDQVATSTVGNVYGFHGRPVDPETGLVYFRNRYYDPELGRFLTADPLGYVDGPSMYGYAGNDPLNKHDPLGLYGVDFHFYIVYYMSHLALGDREAAYRIAFSSQYVDDYAKTAPFSMVQFNALGQTGLDLYYAKVLQPFHFPALLEGTRFGVVARDNPLARHLVASSILRSDPGDEFSLGMALHSYADSFSHESFVGSVDDRNIRSDPKTHKYQKAAPLGHMHAGHEVDLPYNDPVKAADAAIQIYRIVRLYGEAKGAATNSSLGHFEVENLRQELVELFTITRDENSAARSAAFAAHIGSKGVFVPGYTSHSRYRDQIEAARKSQIESWANGQQRMLLPLPIPR